jgi:hypothetical protein
MPVNHVVLLKFNEGVAAGRIDQHLRALATLRDRVPGVTALSLGTNFSERSRGYTHALVVTLRDRAALAAYGPHPAHVEVAAPLREDAELLVVDYDF